MVDYILVPRELDKNVIEFVIEDGGEADTGSDHNVIWCILRLGEPKKEEEQIRYKWRVDGRTEWDEYKDAINVEFQHWEEWMSQFEWASEEQEVEAIWAEWKKRLLAAAERGIGKKRITRNTKGWWSAEAEEAIKARREVCRKMRWSRNRGQEVNNLWKEYQQRRRVVKKVIRKEKKENRKRTLDKIKEQGGPSCKLFWSDLRGKKKRPKVLRMKKPGGEVVDEPEQVVEVMAQHWEELGRRRNSEQTATESEGGETREESNLCHRVARQEVMKVLRVLKRGKAAGPDNILNEMLSNGGGRLVTTMVQLFNIVSRDYEVSSRLEKELYCTVV